MQADKIRNFCIIAHIDHGKSTIADRILEVTGAVQAREMQAQYLDSMELERERGITIKSQAVRLSYTADDGETYQLHLIDTPGHVDFGYEVSRSLAACEGALLVVDAAQGVEAQTLANVYLAIDADLSLIPVLNKIDLPAARPVEVCAEIEDGIGIDTTNAIPASAKNGIGIKEILEAVVKEIPPPTGDPDAPLRAMIFDSSYDAYRGVLIQVRVVDGTMRKGDKLRFMQAEQDYELLEIRVHTPKIETVNELHQGQVGVLVCGIKQIQDVKVGDTITHTKRLAKEMLDGFKEVQQMVFCGIFPVDSVDYSSLRDALGKLALNDASFSWEPETSAALGFGFRCGFLGLLHMEVIQERLEREYGLDLITTAPSVVYRCEMTDGSEFELSNPGDLPESDKRLSVSEPYVRCTVHTPAQFIGPIVKLCTERRGIQTDLRYLSESRVVIEYELPLAEIIYDFFDRLKTVTRGYGSLDYEMIDFRSGSLVKLDILVNSEPVDALSLIVHADSAYDRGRDLVQKLRKLIPRQQFDVPIQAALGRKIISRETIKALRKDVTAKCYGGDISRKRKLLEKQKRGKKRMKQVGNVEIPQSAFLAVLSTD
ncbi:MAG: translation elongation factor 4 [Myxococcales bacterium]|nr:translation elongation factor 4 [Myxococcales bacterium]